MFALKASQDVKTRLGVQRQNSLCSYPLSLIPTHAVYFSYKSIKKRLRQKISKSILGGNFNFFCKILFHSKNDSKKNGAKNIFKIKD